MMPLAFICLPRGKASLYDQGIPGSARKSIRLEMGSHRAEDVFLGRRRWGQMCAAGVPADRGRESGTRPKSPALAARIDTAGCIRYTSIRQNGCIAQCGQYLVLTALLPQS